MIDSRPLLVLVNDPGFCSALNRSRVPSPPVLVGRPRVGTVTMVAHHHRSFAVRGQASSHYWTGRVTTTIVIIRPALDR